MAKVKKEPEISQELLSVVLDIPLEDNPKYKEGMLFYRDEFDSRVWTELDIHRLAYLCKQWAFTKRYNVYSLGKWRDSSSEDYMSYSVTIKTFDEDIAYAMNKCYNDRFHADSEPGAIFASCEWIRLKIEKEEK